MSLKKYVTKRTDKLLPYSELCEHALGYIMLEEVYIVQVVFCEAHRAVMMPIHRLSAHSTCRKLHVWFNSTQPSVLHRLLLVVCCYSSAVYCVIAVPTALFVASPCHLVFSEYVPVNVQCRLYNFTAAGYVVTQSANTFRISCLNLKGVTSLDLCVLYLEATFIT